MHFMSTSQSKLKKRNVYQFVIISFFAIVCWLMMEFKSNRLGYDVRVNQVSHFLSGFRTITPKYINYQVYLSKSYSSLKKNSPKMLSVYNLSQLYLSSQHNLHIWEGRATKILVTQKLKVISTWPCHQGQESDSSSRLWFSEDHTFSLQDIDMKS